MKHPLISFLTLSLGLNVVLALPTLAQHHFGRMPFAPTKTTLYAQSQGIETLIQQAIQYTQQGKPQEAIETFQQVLEISKQQGIKEIEGIAHLRLGFNYDNTENPKLTVNSFQ